MGATISKNKFNQLVKAANESPDISNKIEKKADEFMKQLRAEKLVTNAEQGMILIMKGITPFKDKKGEVVTEIIRYQDQVSGKLVSISFRDLINKLVVKGTNGTSVGATAKFEKGVWRIPTAIYINSVEDEEVEKQTYPITSYNGYSSSIFDGTADEIQRAINTLKENNDLKGDAKPFLKTIEVVVNKTEISTLL